MPTTDRCTSRLATARLRAFPLLAPILLVPTLLALAACGGGGDGASGGNEVLPADVVVGIPEGTDIWIFELVPIVGGGLAADSPRNLTSRPGYDNQPNFDSQGHLLFTQGEGERTDLWRWDPGANIKHRLTSTPDESEYSATPIPGAVPRAVSYVKVEPDSTQRLWGMQADGSNVGVLLENVAPVGYHAWLDATHVALFVLGDPATLQVADITTGEARVVAERPGRTPQTIPGRTAVSFTAPGANGATELREYDLATDRVRTITTLPEGADYHAWTPDGVLLATTGARIMGWHDGQWTLVGDFAMLGQTFSRLAVNPTGTQLAVVAEPVSSGESER